MAEKAVPTVFSRKVKSLETSSSSEVSPKSQSLIGAALEVSNIISKQTNPPTLSIAQRRSAQAILPKLVVREGPAAAEALSTVALNQPGLSPVPQPSAPLLPPPSQPIALPLPRHETTSPTTTPLNAPEEKAGTYFPFFDTTPKKPQISQSLRPSYQRPKSTDKSNFIPVSPQRQHAYKQRNIPTQQEGVSALSSQFDSMPSERGYTRSSPFSPTMASTPSVLAPAGPRTPTMGRRGKNLQLPPLPLPLPRFHPLNYPAADDGSDIKVRPPTLYQSSRSPQPHRRQFSDAQQKLKSYQREVLANATRASLAAAAMAASIPPGNDTPKAPHLKAHESPGPATPLALEEGDYMMAGRHGPILGEGSPRELVDQMILDENERRMGLHSGPSSPALSPAGGRG